MAEDVEALEKQELMYASRGESMPASSTKGDIAARTTRAAHDDGGRVAPRKFQAPQQLTNRQPKSVE